MVYPPLCAQLIVFSRQMEVAANVEQVLDAVKAAGFDAIECGVGLGAEDPRGFARLLDRKGVKIGSFHGGVSTDLSETFRLADIVGVRDLCFSNIGGWENTSADSYLRGIETANYMCEACARRGIHLHYHNHAYEFAPSDRGPSGMELMLEHLDARIDLCVDVAWVHIAGLDPAAFLREHADRVGYVHLKDYTGDRHWVPLGQGVVPLAEVMGAVEELQRARWVAYEQDTSDLPAAEACAQSRRYLAETFGY
ncbi:MAG TPA: sugar phosphate isomerase/epimerase [Chloroflexi bacterium]|jgi:sugar phosphate isomerase/epimerase|nr:sugar phosphate isomerase/epimerase [Chloroflexota bacterium]